MKEIKGDLVKLAKQGKFDVIAHGCNCFCNMGAGIALQIKKVFPEAYEADCKTDNGCNRKLGTYTFAVSNKYESPVTICNAYTQYAFGRNKVQADLEFIKLSCEAIARDFPDAKIGVPQIGAGLGGGKWEDIQPILEEAFKDCDCTLVIYDQ